MIYDNVGVLPILGGGGGGGGVGGGGGGALGTRLGSFRLAM